MDSLGGGVKTEGKRWNEPYKMVHSVVHFNKMAEVIVATWRAPSGALWLVVVVMTKHQVMVERRSNVWVLRHELKIEVVAVIL